MAETRSRHLEADPPLPDAQLAPQQEPPEPAASFEVFRRRREALLQRIGDGVAVLPAAPELFKSRDTAVRYRQNSDFHYLTGFGEPEAIAVLTPHDPEHRFTLFVRPRDPEREVWDGRRAGVEGALDSYGADAAYPLAELDEHLSKLIEPADRLFYALGEESDLERRIVRLFRDFRHRRQRSGKGPAAIEDPANLLWPMRLIKEAEEVEHLRVAAKIGVEGHLTAIRHARPEIGEWELEALLDSTFRGAGGAGPAFPSIVASGANATVLHYVANDRRVRDGELILIDAGAEWETYCSDISRTFPVSGRFSAPQRAVYEIVLAAEEAAIAAVRPGTPVEAVHEAALDVLVDGMLDLGLLKGERESIMEEEAYKKFFMHRTSHWLGLDVHDVGLYKNEGEPVELAAGMVLTVEPGLYIAADAEDVPDEFRGIGVRIEDDVVVTESGHEVLTRGVPVDPEEIERLVGSA